MDILNIDFESLLPHVINVFVHMYGEMHGPIISERINKALILQYQDRDGAGHYARFLKGCKRREFAMEFLHRIGIDIEPYKKVNFTEELDLNVKKLLEPYIYDAYLGMCNSTADNFAPLRAFDPSNSENPSKLLKNRIKLVNYLRGEDKEKLTEETFHAFTETEEYRVLLEKINELRIVHDALILQCSEWEKCTIPYEDYEKKEQERERKILQNKKDELFFEITSDLPSAVKTAMIDKSLEEQQKMLFGHGDIGSAFCLESFRSEQMAKLNSPNVSIDDKSWIVLYQRWYLEGLGVSIPKQSIDELETTVRITNHLEFLKQDDIKDYIPSEDLINHITALRKEKYEEALKEYYTTRADFIEIWKKFNNNPNVIALIYECIKDESVCILGGAGTSDGKFIAIMFYTARSGDEGYLFGSFLHEIGHVIDQTEKGCGFEPIGTFDTNSERNAYDKDFRKYEKFNEAINDMFKIEAIEFLQNQGIYHIEPQEFTILNISDYNTKAITRDLLKPLLQGFRQKVINAKIKVQQEELTRYIGVENFEELVDAINKVDFLSRNGLVDKLEDSPDDPMVKEYYEQVARVEQIYANIENYNSHITRVTITPSDTIISSIHR